MIKAQNISTYDYEDCVKLTKLLIKNHYVCMISVEDTRTDGTCLYVINFIECLDEANRNDVSFMSNDDLEDLLNENNRCEL